MADTPRAKKLAQGWKSPTSMTIGGPFITGDIPRATWVSDHTSADEAFHWKEVQTAVTSTGATLQFEYGRLGPIIGCGTTHYEP